MNRIKVYGLITILLCYVSIAAKAQDVPSEPVGNPTGKITGRLLDSKNKPLPYAQVTLLKSDSSEVTGNLSQDDGSFIISSTGFGSFILSIYVIGSKPQLIGNISISAAAPEKNMGDIKLSEINNTLNEVEIKGERPLMQMSIDKKVFNVEKDATSEGGSALDALQNVPSISVDADGNVTLRGKPVTILIDGKPATLLGSDIPSALRSLPRSALENIETITNPSAKYDAQGTAGIVNLVTKKDSRMGINGVITLGVGTNYKYNGNIGLNARKGKWNVFLNSSYRYVRNYNSTTTERVNSVGSVYNYGSSFNFEADPRVFTGSFNTLGATYDWNARNSITLTQNLSLFDNAYSDISYYYTCVDRPLPPDYATNYLVNTNRNSDASGGPTSYATSLDYKHKFHNKDEELTTNATYSYSDYHREQQYNTIIQSNDPNEPSLGPIKESAPSVGSNGSFVDWVDYTKPLFTKNGKLGLGLKNQFIWYESKNMPLVDSFGTSIVLDSTLYNDYHYTQQIHAAYANWSDQFNEKITYQFGLRGEYAVYDAVNYVDSARHSYNEFLNVFPTAYISYQLPKQQSIYLNYGRRTNRPNVWQLMPFKDVSNPLVVSQGNPDLEPEFINNIEFSYNKQTRRGDNIILSAYFQYTENLIERITTPINDSLAKARDDLAPYKGKQYIRPLNLGSGTTYGLDMTGHVIILPGWDAILNANLFQNYIKVGDLDNYTGMFVSDKEGFSWRGKVNTSVKLPQNFSLQVNAQYESEKIIAQGYMEATAWMDLAVKKTFGDNKLTLIFTLSDVFNSHKYSSIYDIPGQYYETYYRNRETNIGNFSLTYRFGRSLQDKIAPGIEKHKSKTSTDNTTQPSPQKERENNLKEHDDNSNEQNNPTNNNNNNPPPPSKEPTKSNGTHM